MRPASPTRRLVLATAGAALLPRVAWGQPVKRRRIAILVQGSRADRAVSWEAFWQGLRALGYADQELAIESRWADGRVERLPELAVELLGLAPEVIVVGSSAAALAAKRATSKIPIVGIFADPVGAGLVTSFPHPGGNVTGLSPMGEDIVAEQLELLKTVVPHAERIAVLFDPSNPAHAGVLHTVRQAAGTSLDRSS